MTNRAQTTRTYEERHDTKDGTIPATPVRLPRRWPDSHFVYVIEDKDHRAVKIGIAKDPYRRAILLQAGNPCELWVHQYFEVINASRARDIEIKTHKALKGQRLMGEWFNVTTQAACEAIRRAAGHMNPCMPKIESSPLLGSYEARGEWT